MFSFVANSDIMGMFQAIPIKDPVVLPKIHQTYRVAYLKVILYCFLCRSCSSFTCIVNEICAFYFLFQDVILPRALDEATVANLNSIIHSNNAIVKF